VWPSCTTGKAAKKNQKKRAKRKDDHEGQEGWEASSANGSTATPHAAADGLQGWDSAAGDGAGAEGSSAGGGRFITSESCSFSSGLVGTPIHRRSVQLADSLDCSPGAWISRNAPDLCLVMHRKLVKRPLCMQGTLSSALTFSKWVLHRFCPFKVPTEGSMGQC
jgi:hypothetical protein